ncbi:hypothetical protein BDA96_01G497400 [Sorghum bicolor]|uniref:Uncharacterized protein n=2 Tax=Sorghum bicolor TaxID=4558 RepID=A0A921V2H3_SORBI|nr:hypothetical protein BDA96_01G497400 [Sorghum bicolor]OQU93048.1 hypothetical protein SORBI_3001G466450 [Sorghum bicolor]
MQGDGSRSNESMVSGASLVRSIWWGCHHIIWIDGDMFSYLEAIFCVKKKEQGAILEHLEDLR